MPFAERRKINMKKRTNLGKKLVTMLVSVGFFAVLITVLNLMALQAIRGKNNVLIEQFEQYEEAVENNDTAVFETAKGEVAEAIRHSNYKINGSIIFDLALVAVDIIVIVLLSIVINKSIVRPAKRAKNDLDDIILGIESGQGNLTLRVFDETSDEIGQLANGVNHFIETLQNLMVKIQSVSKDMKKSSYLVQNEAESSNMSASNVSATSEELAASMEEVSASLYDLAQGCNNLLKKMEGMNEDAKNSAMKMHEVKLTAENSYKEAIASKEKTVETFDGIEKDVAEAVEASKSCLLYTSPVADKLTQAAMLICLFTRFPHMLLLIVIMAGKELYMVVSGCLVIRKTGKVHGADWHGKIVTFLLYGTAAVHIIWFQITSMVSDLLIGLCAIMMVISVALYIIPVSYTHLIKQWKDFSDYICYPYSDFAVNHDIYNADDIRCRWALGRGNSS